MIGMKKSIFSLNLSGTPRRVLDLKICKFMEQISTGRPLSPKATSRLKKINCLIHFHKSFLFSLI